MWLLIWLNMALFFSSFFYQFPSTFAASFPFNTIRCFFCASLSKIWMGIKFYSEFHFYEVKVVHLAISLKRFTSFIRQNTQEKNTEKNRITTTNTVFIIVKGIAVDEKSVAERYKFIDKQVKVTQSAKITKNCFFFSR